MNVSKRSLVSFSIGKNYKDEILSDVAPMDACHLLLGRPWQYDRRVIHDGFKNTYSFEKDGVKIKLAPLKMDANSRPKNDVVDSLLTIAQVERYIAEGEILYALMVVEANKMEET